jgi:hypothetical protein
MVAAALLAQEMSRRDSPVVPDHPIIMLDEGGTCLGWAFSMNQRFKPEVSYLAAAPISNRRTAARFVTGKIIPEPFTLEMHNFASSQEI